MVGRAPTSCVGHGIFGWVAIMAGLAMLLAMHGRYPISNIHTVEW